MRSLIITLALSLASIVQADTVWLTGTFDLGSESGSAVVQIPQYDGPGRVTEAFVHLVAYQDGEMCQPDDGYLISDQVFILSYAGNSHRLGRCNVWSWAPQCFSFASGWPSNWSENPSIFVGDGNVSMDFVAAPVHWSVVGFGRWDVAVWNCAGEVRVQLEVDVASPGR